MSAWADLFAKIHECVFKGGVPDRASWYAEAYNLIMSDATLDPDMLYTQARLALSLCPVPRYDTLEAMSQALVLWERFVSHVCFSLRAVFPGASHRGMMVGLDQEPRLDNWLRSCLPFPHELVEPFFDLVSRKTAGEAVNLPVLPLTGKRVIMAKYLGLLPARAKRVRTKKQLEREIDICVSCGCMETYLVTEKVREVVVPAWNFQNFELLQALTHSGQHLQYFQSKLEPVELPLGKMTSMAAQMWRACKAMPSMEPFLRESLRPLCTYHELFDYITNREKWTTPETYVAMAAYDQMDSDAQALLHAQILRFVKIILENKTNTLPLADFLYRILPCEFRSQALLMLEAEQSARTFGFFVLRGWQEETGPVPMPSEFKHFLNTQSRFEGKYNEYERTHPSQRFDLASAFGRVQLRVGAHRYVMKPLQAIVVMRLTGPTPIKMILKDTRCSMSDLFTLAHRKNGPILQVRAKDKGHLSGDDLVRLNEAAGNQRGLTVLLQMVYKPRTQGHVSRHSITEKEAQSSDDRQRVLSANIVRLLKAKGSMSYNDLLDAIKNKVDNVIEFRTTEFKLCVDRLIDDEYVERDKTTRSVLIYVA